MTIKELPNNISICSNCDKQTNDDTNTMWDCDGDPYCIKCFTGQEG